MKVPEARRPLAPFRHAGRRTVDHVLLNGHAATMTWSQARTEHFPDHRVRRPIDHPPN